MKKLLLTLSLATACFAAYAQNTFPTNGKVGIGTTAPASDLHIWEPTDSKPGGVTAPTISILKLTRNGTPDYTYNESAEFRIGHGGPTYWGSQLDLFLNGGSNTTNVPDQQVMTWLYNGNVGIGTTSPLDKLDIAGTSSSPGRVVFGDGGNYAPYMKFYKWAGSGSIFNQTTIVNSLDAAGAISFQTGIGGAAIGSDIQTTRMIITQQGNVGIGTISSHGYTFAVNGSAIATSFTVQSYANWPDYVFKSDYKLLPLNLVKAYIDQNHHLPDVLSAEQVAKDGLNLGDMSKITMQKVEELTLYLIEKDKQLNDEKEINSKQQQQIDTQSEQLKSQQEQLDQLKTQLSIIVKQQKN